MSYFELQEYLKNYKCPPEILVVNKFAQSGTQFSLSDQVEISTLEGKTFKYRIVSAIFVDKAAYHAGAYVKDKGHGWLKCDNATVVQVKKEDIDIIEKAKISKVYYILDPESY